MPSVGKTHIEHYSDSNVKMHDILVEEFMLAHKNRLKKTIYGKDGSVLGEEDITLEILQKLTSSIGYLQQTEASLTKNIYTEKDIKNINRRLDRIPPEVLQSYMNPTLLDPLEAK